MRKSTRIALSLTLVACLGFGTFALSGCKKNDGGSTSTGKQGGTMSFYIGEPAYIDPWNCQESEGMQVVQTLFDSLTTVDDLDPTKLMPAAAKSWESSKDAKVWTFKLDPNGKFADGSKVTAQDFVYAWNRVVNPNSLNTLTSKKEASEIDYHLGFVDGYNDVRPKIPEGTSDADTEKIMAGAKSEMKGLVAVDDLTLQVTLSQPFADFAYVVSHPSLGPVQKSAVENGVEYNGKKVPFGDMPVGNGPFKMAEPWSHDQSIKVVANKDYGTGDKPFLDGVDFKIFKDPETAYSEFEAGTLDFTQIGAGKIKDAKAKYGESKNGYTVQPGEQVLLGPENSIYYLIINNKDAIFKDPAIRKAITYAINRQAICDIVFEGTREPADNILPPGIAGYDKGAWKDSKYDINAAKKALADAGYPEGKGLPTIKLSFNSGGGHEKIMELIQADLTAIGIKTQFDSADFPVYLKQLNEGNHQLARLGWIADYPIAYNFLFSIFDSSSADNKTFYSNPEVEKAMRDAEGIVDDKDRVDAFKKINDTIQSTNPAAPIMFYKHHHVGSEKVNDFTFSAMYLGNFSKVWLSK